MNTTEISEVAIHEAGHALLGMRYSTLDRVFIREDGGGSCLMKNTNDSLDLARAGLAGPAATCLLGLTKFDPGHVDIRRVAQILDDRAVSGYADPSVRALVVDVWVYLRENVQSLLRIAGALQDRKILTGADVSEILKAGREFDRARVAAEKN